MYLLTSQLDSMSPTESSSYSPRSLPSGTSLLENKLLLRPESCTVCLWRRLLNKDSAVPGSLKFNPGKNLRYASATVPARKVNRTEGWSNLDATAQQACFHLQQWPGKRPRTWRSLSQQWRTQTIGKQMADYCSGTPREVCNSTRWTHNLGMPVKLFVVSIFQATVRQALANSLFFWAFAFLARRSALFSALMNAQ